MKKIFLSLVALASCFAVVSHKEMRMEVIVPSYNNAAWYIKNLSSILEQNYTNYHVTYIDDASSDGTADLVEKYVREQGHEDIFTLVRNHERRGALENLYHAIYQCADDAIIVTVDGDDWLYDANVLQKLNTIYSQGNVWITHGKLIETASNWAGWCIPVPEEIIRTNDFRSFRCPSHLRTFYAWLFKKIKTEDLMYEGRFFPMTWDQAMMFPMMEMAGERHAFVDDIVYVYNTTTPISDNKVNPQLQRDLEALIRAMPKYQRLADEEAYQPSLLKSLVSYIVN